MNLDVFCVYWGDKYDVSYVYALQEMVKKNLTIPHTFKCITTQKIEGVHTVLPFVSYQGWWQKIGLFAPRVAIGPSIYFDLDVVIERSINHSRALHALRLFESAGVKCVNSFQVASVCGDKLLTSAALEDNNITQPEIKIAFTETSALEAIEEMGYPVVLKPAVGSWGRLLAKI